MWTTTAGLYAQINGSTVGPFAAGGVSTTGSPASGDAAFFSGSGTITNAAGILAGGTFTAAALAGGLRYAASSGTFSTDAASIGFYTSAVSSATLTGANYCVGAWANVDPTGSTASGSRVVALQGVLQGYAATGSAGTYTAVRAYCVKLGDANLYTTAATFIGVEAAVIAGTTATSGTLMAAVIGVRSGAGGSNQAGSGNTTITNAYDFLSNPAYFVQVAAATTTVTNSYGLYLAAPVLTGSGTLTITNRYGVYQADAVATNVFAGLVSTSASTTTRAGLRVAHGTAPTSPVNGDIWTTTAGLYARINSATVGPFVAGSFVSPSGSPVSTNLAIFSGASAITNAAGIVAGTTLNAAASSGALQFTHSAGTYTGTAGFSVATHSAGASGNVTGIVSNLAASLTVSGAPTGAARLYGLSGTVSPTLSAGAGSAAMVGVFGEVSSITSDLNANVVVMSGVRGSITINNFTTGAGSIASQANAFDARLTLSSTAASGNKTIAVATLFYGAPIFSGQAAATLTVFNYYGLYLSTPTLTNATITNNYGVYQADPAAINLFSGPVGCGIAPVTSTALNLAVSTTTVSSLRIGHGSAPTLPVNGDIWTTTAGMYAQINGATVGPFAAGGGVTTTGSPASGQLSFFSGSSSITNAAGIAAGSSFAATASDLLALTYNGGVSSSATPTTAMTVNANFSGAVGTLSAAAFTAYLTCTGTFAAGEVRGGRLSVGVQAASAVSAGTVYLGGEGLADAVSGTTNTLASAILSGLRGRVTFLSTATTTGVGILGVSGVISDMGITLNSGAGVTTTITDAYNFFGSTAVFSALGGTAGTITNFYGLYLAAPSLNTVTITNRYGVYQADASARNVFAGSAHSFGTTAITTGALSHLGTGGIKTINAATQDGIIIKGRAGGTSSFSTTITTGTLTGSRTWTIPEMGVPGTFVAGSGTVNTVAYWLGTNMVTGAGGLLTNGTQAAIGGIAVSTTASLTLSAGTTGVSSLRITHGVAPTTPVDGDMWSTTTGLFVRINGATVGLGAATPGGSTTQLQYNNAGALGGIANSVYLATAPGASFSTGLSFTRDLDGSTFSKSYDFVSTSAGHSNTVSGLGVSFGATSSSGTAYGIVNSTSVTTKSGGALYGIRNDVSVGGGSMGGDALVGMGQQLTTSATSLLEMYGVNTFATVNNNVTTIYGSYLGLTVNAGTVATLYGLFLATPTVSGGSITTRWGVYQADSASRNFLAGNTFIACVNTATITGNNSVMIASTGSIAPSIGAANNSVLMGSFNSSITGGAHYSLVRGASNTCAFIHCSVSGEQSKAVQGYSVVHGYGYYGATQGTGRGGQGEKITFPTLLTTSATATPFVGSGYSVSLIMDNDSTMVVLAQVVGYQEGVTANAAGYTVEFTAKRVGSAATTAIVGTTVVRAQENNTAWNVTVTADTTQGGININVVGVAATNISWHAVAYVTRIKRGT
jgi:hypothetical protein